MYCGLPKTVLIKAITRCSSWTSGTWLTVEELPCIFTDELRLTYLHVHSRISVLSCSRLPRFFIPPFCIYQVHLQCVSWVVIDFVLFFLFPLEGMKIMLPSINRTEIYITSSAFLLIYLYLYFSMDYVGGAGNFLGKTSVDQDQDDPMLLSKASVFAGQRFLSVTTWNVAAINNNVSFYVPHCFIGIQLKWLLPHVEMIFLFKFSTEYFSPLNIGLHTKKILHMRISWKISNPLSKIREIKT